MKKKTIISIIAFFIILISLGLVYSFLSKLPPNLQECLKKQEEIYKPGFEGEPTRVANKCEEFAESTKDLNAIQILTDTRDFPTLVAIARNPNAETLILAKIYERDDLTEQWINPLHSGLARNTNTSGQILGQLAESPGTPVWILEDIAGNASTPVNTLRMIAKSKNSNVLRKLASNSKTPPDILIFLANDLKSVSFPFQGEEDINIELARNPSTPKEILVKFLKEKGNTSVVDNFEDNITRVEREILELEDFYKSAFENGQSKYYALVYNLAKNPQTSESTLRTILERYANLTNVSYGYSVKTLWGSKSVSETIPEAAKKNLDSRI